MSERRSTYLTYRLCVGRRTVTSGCGTTAPHIDPATSSKTSGTAAALLSNAALLVAALHFAGGGRGAEATAFPAFEVLGVCTAAEALGFAVVWLNMVPRYRPTLWRRRTAQQHVELTRPRVYRLLQ